MYKNILLLMVIYFSAATKAYAEINSYRLVLTPDFQTRSVEGKAEISLTAKSIFNFKTDSFVIKNIRLNNKVHPFKVENNQIVIDLKNQKKNSLVTITYHAVPKNGLVFGENYIYSNFFTCDWMPCSGEPEERFPFELEITLPRDFKMVASGKQLKVRPEGKTKNLHIWKQVSLYSSYLLGFAAGNFNEYEEIYNGNHLKYFGISDGPDELKKKFQDTTTVLNFFEEKAGVSLPNKSYTQVLVPDSEAQEKSSFSIIGKPFLDPIITNPQEDWVIVHELAHQWWGNAITCKNWNHFWLNEGLTVFMTAAYKQKKWGEEAYQKEMDLIKKRYQKAVDAKLDVPLTYAGPYPSLQLKRAIVYSKGALFLDALRKHLGDEVFWKGLREYTVAFNGKTVESKDFQNSFEKSSAKDLSEIFNKWVY